MSIEQERLAAAIAALESQRTLLGDAVVDAALGPLREKLATLSAPPGGADPDLRQVTILFLDVVGSTRLSTRLDPEDVNAVMDGALARFTKIVQAHGGKVLQYAGDNLLAVFGAELSREDDAERAVRCGLALLDEARVHQAAVRRAHAHDGFDVRVGLHTGGVLLGAADGVDGAGSIRGRAVNVAARMEQLAPPGQLRISQATHALVRGLFHAERQAPVPVKGVEEPMVTYLVRAAAAAGAPARGVEGVDTRMVGREAEMAALQQAFARLASQRRLQRIHIVGDAGLGKSRLLKEFNAWLRDRAEPVLQLQVRATPATQSRPYGLLRELLASWLGVADDADAAVARERFELGMVPLLREADAADEGGSLAQAQAHALGHLIGLDYAASPHVQGIVDDGRQIRQRGFHAGVRALRNLCARNGAPLLLQCDDLHWADEGSLDFLDQLAREGGHLPIAIVGLMRPELFERRAIGAMDEAVLRIDLQPLGAHGSQRLADEVLKKLPAAPPALRAALVARAEGNPFFMEELVNLLIDQRVIEVEAGPWSVRQEGLSIAAVPPTLTGVLQGRLDHLPALERRALRHASAIGVTFWDRALDDSALAALPSLLARGLVHPRRDDALEGAQAYAFKHQLFHRVVYDTLLKRERRECHARAAQWLSGLSSARVNDFAAAIAEHHERAGDPAQARRCYARAAQHARERFAHAEALALVARALALADDEVPAPDALPLRWRLLDVQERTLDSLGRRAEQRGAIDALHQVAEAMADDARRGEVVWRRCDIALRTNDFAATERLAREALELGVRAGDVGLQLRARHRLAAALRAQGDVAGGKAMALAGLNEARAHASRALEVLFLNSLCGFAEVEQDLEASVGFAREMLALDRAAGDRRGEAFTLINLGSALHALGSDAQARVHLERGLQVARAVGERHPEPYALLALSQSALRVGEADVAAHHAHAALELARGMQAPLVEAHAWCRLGEAERARRRMAQAEAAFGCSRRIAADKGYVCEHDAAAGLAACALDDGDAAKALAALAHALDHLAAGGRFDGAEHPLWNRWVCWQALARAGDARAAVVLAAAREELVRRAERITDLSLRDGFLRIPEHAAIIEAGSR